MCVACCHHLSSRKNDSTRNWIITTSSLGSVGLVFIIACAALTAAAAAKKGNRKCREREKRATYFQFFCLSLSPSSTTRQEHNKNAPLLPPPSSPCSASFLRNLFPSGPIVHTPPPPPLRHVWHNIIIQTFVEWCLDFSYILLTDCSSLEICIFPSPSQQQQQIVTATVVRGGGST